MSSSPSVMPFSGSGAGAIMEVRAEVLLSAAALAAVFRVRGLELRGNWAFRP